MKLLLLHRGRESHRGLGGREGQGGCLIFPLRYSSPSLDDIAELGPFVDSHSVIFAEHCDCCYHLFLSVSHSNGL